MRETTTGGPRSQVYNTAALWVMEFPSPPQWPMFPRVVSMRYYRLYRPLSSHPLLNVGKMTIPKPTPARNVAQNRSQVPFRTNLTGGSSGVVDCRDLLIESCAMNDEEELNAQRTRLMEIWHAYGQTFNSFVPEEQPFPEEWEPEVPGEDDKGRLSPQALKHWEQLFPTKKFLCQRYAEHHILEGPSLWFDCLVPKFQRRMHYRVAEDEHGNPQHIPVRDTHEWYDSALRIGIFRSQVGFSCRSMLCERRWCKLHMLNPQRISPVDIYSLVDIFEACGLAQAVSIVAKWFGVKLQAFRSAGIGPVKGYRYAVPKQALYELLARYPTMRHQHVEAFIREAAQLIRGCPLVPWHGRMFEEERAFLSQKLIGNLFRIKSAAAKAYLWLLMVQEERARNTRESSGVTDSELGAALSVSLPTAGTYRRELENKGLVQVEVKKRGKNREITIRKVKY
jgi:hypothetical protein